MPATFSRGERVRIAFGATYFRQWEDQSTSCHKCLAEFTGVVVGDNGHGEVVVTGLGDRKGDRVILFPADLIRC